MIQTKTLGLFSNQGYVLDDLLEKNSLQYCVEIIKKWNMINSNLQRKTDNQERKKSACSKIGVRRMFNINEIRRSAENILKILY